MAVIVNAKGDVDAVRVLRPIGLGLDDEAVKTLRTWKFEPATRNGLPVLVRVMIEIEFRM